MTGRELLAALRELPDDVLERDAVIELDSATGGRASVVISWAGVDPFGGVAVHAEGGELL